MDSDSDWDSFSGMRPAMNTKSEVKIPTKQHQTFDGPLKSKSNSHHKQLQDRNASVSPKNENRTSATVFVDKGDYGSTENRGFQSVELEDKSYLEKQQKRNEKDKKKKKIPLSEEVNLPYTNFHATNNDKSHHSNTLKKQTLQKNKNYTIEKPAEDDENSWDDTDSDATEKIMENNNIINGDSYMEEPYIALNLPTNKDNRITETKSDLSLFYPVKKSKTTRSSSPPMKDGGTHDEKENGYNMQPNEKRFYYEKAYYDCYTVAVETTPTAVVPEFADRIQKYVRRGWQEFFGVLQIIVDFFVIFVLELLRFLSTTLLQKLMVGVITLVGDQLLKPLLSSIFNSILQPLFVLLWNFFVGVRQLLQPFIKVIADVVQPLAVLLGAIRLFEYRTDRKGTLKEI